MEDDGRGGRRQDVAWQILATLAHLVVSEHLARSGRIQGTDTRKWKDSDSQMSKKNSIGLSKFSKQYVWTAQPNGIAPKPLLDTKLGPALPGCQWPCRDDLGLQSLTVASELAVASVEAFSRHRAKTEPVCPSRVWRRPVPDFDGAVVTGTGQRGGVQLAHADYRASVPLQGLVALEARLLVLVVVVGVPDFDGVVGTGSGQHGGVQPAHAVYPVLKGVEAPAAGPVPDFDGVVPTGTGQRGGVQPAQPEYRVSVLQGLVAPEPLVVVGVVPDFDSAIETGSGQRDGVQPAHAVYPLAVPLKGVEAPAAGPVPDFHGAVLTGTGQRGGAQPAQGENRASVPLEGLEAPPAGPVPDFDGAVVTGTGQRGGVQPAHAVYTLGVPL